MTFDDLCVNSQYLITANQNPRDPDKLKTVRVVNLLSVMNLLRVVIHYCKCSESLHLVVIYYVLSSESQCVTNSLRSSKTLRIELHTKNSTGGSFRNPLCLANFGRD